MKFLETTANISWSPPPPEDQNGIIRHYSIELTDKSTGLELNIIAEAEYYLLDFLEPHTTYTYRIAAVTIQPGPFTELKNFTTSQGGMFAPYWQYSCRSLPMVCTL